MLQWETADENADYPFERYRAVSGKREYRIFYGSEEPAKAVPWMLAVREVGETGEYTQIHRDTHQTAYHAKRAAELREQR